MPLYKHTASGERVRTVTDSPLDVRLNADAAYELVKETAPNKPAKAPRARATTGAEVSG